MRSQRLTLLAVLVGALATQPVVAQRGCWRASNGRECIAPVFEVQFGFDLLNGFDLAPGPYTSIGLGFMGNIGTKWAAGALVDYQFSRPVSSYGIRIRGRRRITNNGEELGGFEAEAGVLKTRKWPMTSSSGKPLVREDERGWGISTGLRINYLDRGLVFLRHDMTWVQPLAPAPQPLPLEPLGPAHRRHALLLGAGGGSEIAGALLLPWLFLRLDTACERGEYC